MQMACIDYVRRGEVVRAVNKRLQPAVTGGLSRFRRQKLQISDDKISKRSQRIVSIKLKQKIQQEDEIYQKILSGQHGLGRCRRAKL